MMKKLKVPTPVTQKADQYLIPNWRRAWKFYTVKFWTALLFLPEILATLSDDVKDYLPGNVRATLSVIALISLILRFKKQEDNNVLDDPSKNEKLS